MKDRLKFRVWNGKQVIYADKYGFYNKVYMGDNGYYQSVRLGTLFENADKYNLTIEQCTGLKDKNGKLIFEGDIVEHVRCYSFGDNYHTGEPFDDDRTTTKIGRIVFYPSKGSQMVGIQSDFNDITGENSKSYKYQGLPSMMSTYAEITGTIHDKE